MRLDSCQMNEFIADLRCAYNGAVKDSGAYYKYTKKITLLDRAVQKPAKSFYISLEEGTRMIHHIDRYGISGKANKLNALKYNDLYRLYLRLKLNYPDIPPLALIQMAVDLPAPRFYIRPQTAGLILNKYINKWKLK